MSREVTRCDVHDLAASLRAETDDDDDRNRDDPGDQRERLQEALGGNATATALVDVAPDAIDPLSQLPYTRLFDEEAARLKPLAGADLFGAS